MQILISFLISSVICWLFSKVLFTVLKHTGKLFYKMSLSWDWSCRGHDYTGFIYLGKDVNRDKLSLSLYQFCIITVKIKHIFYLFYSVSIFPVFLIFVELFIDNYLLMLIYYFLNCFMNLYNLKQ